MSLYAKYLTERTNDRILETGHGFATYRIIPEQKAVYMIDIFVESDFRKAGTATQMLDEISKIAKKEGCAKLMGCVVPSAKNSTESLRLPLSYGMKLASAGVDFVLFEREI